MNYEITVTFKDNQVFVGREGDMHKMDYISSCSMSDNFEIAIDRYENGDSSNKLKEVDTDILPDFVNSIDKIDGVVEFNNKFYNHMTNKKYLMMIAKEILEFYAEEK